MAHRQKSGKRPKPRAVLRLPDLEQSKTAVLNSLRAASSQESYGHAIDEFIGWYCSEPRLAFNRTVVLRYRFFLEQSNLAPSAINVRLAAVRRLAYEAADTGLLSPELAAGIRRVKGAKGLGVRIGNWLTVEQSKKLLQSLPAETVRGKRGRAILALLIGCRLRRAELAGLNRQDFQMREQRWVVADLIGKGRGLPSVPESRIWLRTISAARAPVYAISRAANWSRSSSFWVTRRSKRQSAISGVNRGFGTPHDAIGLDDA
jgi:site-specific recombinase XerC